MDTKPNQHPEPAASRPAQESATADVNLLEYLLVLVRAKRLIGGLTLAGFLLSCLVVLLLPAVYTATARILPPEGQSGLPSRLSEYSGLAALAGIPLEGGNSADLYVGMLASRTLADGIIDKFELQKVYGLNSRTLVRERLAEQVDISAGRDDHIIAIRVEDRDPRRAADMANAFVAELKDLNVKINLSRAGRERQFLEERLQTVKADLQKAEDALGRFQEQNKTIQLDDQARSIIEAIARLKGELASKEVELGMLRSYQTEQNPQVQLLRENIAKLKEQVSKLEQTPAGQSSDGDIFIPTSKVPDLSIRYARLMRNFKVQETLYEVLTKQYEVARVSEARNSSPIQVLDHAVPPDRKSKPRRVLIVLLGTFASAFAAILLAFVRHRLGHLSGEDRERWRTLRDHLPWSRR